MTTDPQERLLDLLCAEATQGLTATEAKELWTLLDQFPDEHHDSLALAAAAADLAYCPTSDQLQPPPSLMERLQREATAFLSAPGPVLGHTVRSSAAGTPWYAWAGWAVAAGLALVMLWANRPRESITPTRPEVSEQLAQLRQEPGTREFAAKTPTATGAIVWNQVHQQGFLEVRGLPPLDPTKEQYQLWIVDATRTDPTHAQPIDGGVFDVKPDGTALIPVRAALKVRDAQAFAITKEPAGGVVVSKGPHLLVLTPKAG